MRSTFFECCRRASLLQSQRADLDAMSELMGCSRCDAASGMPLESLTIKSEPRSVQPITE